MNEQDFNRIKEISEELNLIRIRNNLKELQLKAEERSFTHNELHKEWDEVTLLTRGEHLYKDCKIVSMKKFRNSSEFEDMEYEKYINYK